MVFSRDEQIQDGEQLHRIWNELGPLARLLQRKKDDLFAQWASDKAGNLSRDFCAGALSVIDGLMGDIEQMIARVPELIEEREEEEAREKEMAQVARSQAFDGGGHGDLAS